MPRWSLGKCVYIPENAVDLNSVEQCQRRPAQLPLTGVFIGRLVPYKGADVLIEAAASFLKANQLRLHIVGDGPQKEALDELVQKLGVASNVEFHGWLSHAEVQTILKQCEVLIFPSIREFGGGVVVEAMAQGVPPMVADYAGPSELVDELTGIKVSFKDRESLVQGIKTAIHEVMRSRRFCRSLATPRVIRSSQT